MKTLHVKEILKQILIDTQFDQIQCKMITFDSREVSSDTLFFCKGAQFKIEYLLKAIESGAITYVSEVDYHQSIPCILVSDIRKAMALIADAFYDSPQTSFNLIGVTGTKGKSTTTYFIKKILDHYHEEKTGIISSIDTFDGVIDEESTLTTPEALTLFKHFNNARKAQLNSFVMEVSSQALKYDRVYGLNFDYGIFLNISPDHISPIEHPTFEDYFDSKLKLFQQSKKMIVNLDSDHIETINKHLNDVSILSFSQSNPDAQYQISNLKPHPNSISFTLNNDEYHVGITGLFNAENAAAAIILALDLKIPTPIIQSALSEIRVPGRMELFTTQDNLKTIIVDYAHNTLSFEKLFESTKQSYPNHHISIVFGCPGHKSLNRRQDLGEVSNKYADNVILCEEDPGYEDPTTISLEIAQYLKDVPYQIINDRKKALHTAMLFTQLPQVILFTGKGDETTMKVENKNVEIQSDVSITKELIEIYNETSLI